MFSEGFRHTPRKLAKLTKSNPNAVLMYIYLVDHMDDRLEMTYKMKVSREHNDIGMTRKMARDALSDLVALGAITMSISGKGVLISAVSYPNHSGPLKGHIGATKRATSRATLNKTDIVDIFGNIEDDIISKGHIEGHVEGQHFEQSRATMGGVLYRGDKREKNTIADDMLTPVSLAPQQAESPIPKRRKSTKPKVPPKSGLLFQTYSEEFLAAYACKALRWDVGENAAACRLIDEVGEQEAIEMVRQFFKCKEKFLLTAKHPIKLFFSNKQKYLLQLKEVPKKPIFRTFVDNVACCKSEQVNLNEYFKQPKKG